MTNEKKKGTPFGVPIPKQDYGTTPEEKSEAERLFDKIGTGAAYALRRPKDAKVDRQLPSPAGMCNPHSAIKVKSPTVLSVTVLPPVLGPVIIIVSKSDPKRREIGTTVLESIKG